MKKFETPGRSLSKEEMKKVLGGSDDQTLEPGDGSGGCCAHAVDWSYYSQCGLSQSQAQQAASNFAQQTGGHGYWCCSSC